jgi:hypothetical protein
MLRKVSQIEQQRAVRILRELLSQDEPHKTQIVRQDDDDLPVTINGQQNVRERTVGGSRKGK